MLSGFDFLFAGLAAVAAETVNALAGGGTLITFPVLVALGMPVVSANATNTVSLCPGYLGATLAQSSDLRGQAGRMRMALPAAAIGGLLGGLLLLNTGERAFRGLVPFLILLASLLLAVQEPLRAWLLRRAGKAGAGFEPRAVLPLGLAAVYGGYFGAGLSVIVLAVLGLFMKDNLTRLNALKQAVALATNIAAAAVFVFSEHVSWPAVLIMAGGALIGGAIGGRLAGRVRPAALRWIVVAFGLACAVVYFVRG